MKKAKRFNIGGMAIPVGAYTPQSTSSAGPFDPTATTREVLGGMQSANSPVIRVKKGGYVKSADGIVKRGKTKGRLV